MKIQERRHYETIMRDMQEMCESASRLPQLVFRGGLRPVACFEFDPFSGAAFWNLVQGIGKACGDERVVVAVLDPDPEQYFFKEFREFAAVELEVGSDADTYFDSLATSPDESPADSILHNSDVIVWFGDGKRWLMWGERPVGVVVLGAARPIDIEKICRSAGVQSFSATKAVVELIASNFIDEAVPEAWQADFIANYSAVPQGTDR